MDKTDTVKLLKQARLRMTQQELAGRLQTTTRTLYRWERGQSRCPPFVAPALQEILRMNKTTPDAEAGFTFIDLFAGIGGIRLGFERAGGRCVFTSEWNEWSKKTYLNHFRDDHPFEGDITAVEAARRRPSAGRTVSNAPPRERFSSTSNASLRQSVRRHSCWRT